MTLLPAAYWQRMLPHSRKNTICNQLSDTLRVAAIRKTGWIKADSRRNTDGIGYEIHFMMVRSGGIYINSRNMQHVSHIARKKLGSGKLDYHSLRHTQAAVLAEKSTSPLHYFSAGFEQRLAKC